MKKKYLVNMENNWDVLKMMEKALEVWKINYSNKWEIPEQVDIETGIFCLEILNLYCPYKPTVFVECTGAVSFNFDKGYTLMQTAKQTNTSSWTLICLNQHYSFDLTKVDQIKKLIQIMENHSYEPEYIVIQSLCSS